MTKTALFMVAGALILAACGQGEAVSAAVASLDDLQPAASGEDAVAAEVDTEAAMLAMAECMREQGVEVADPEVDEAGNVLPPRPVDPGTVDREAMQAAREACSEFLEGVEFGFQDVDQTELQDTLLEYAACMRDHGYDMPDPDLSSLGGGPGGEADGGPFGELDPTDPDFVAAQEACNDVLGGFGIRGGGGPGGPPPGGGQG